MQISQPPGGFGAQPMTLGGIQQLSLPPSFQQLTPMGQSQSQFIPPQLGTNGLPGIFNLPIASPSDRELLMAIYGDGVNFVPPYPLLAYAVLQQPNRNVRPAFVGSPVIGPPLGTPSVISSPVVPGPQVFSPSYPAPYGSLLDETAAQPSPTN